MNINKLDEINSIAKEIKSSKEELEELKKENNETFISTFLRKKFINFRFHLSISTMHRWIDKEWNEQSMRIFKESGDKYAVT